MPGLLRGAAGVSYLEYTNLGRPVPVTGLAGSATAWADCLVAEGAATLARYEHPYLGEYAAVTTNRHGAGRVTYVGTVPDRTLAQRGRGMGGVDVGRAGPVAAAAGLLRAVHHGGRRRRVGAAVPAQLELGAGRADPSERGHGPAVRR